MYKKAAGKSVKNDGGNNHHLILNNQSLRHYYMPQRKNRIAYYKNLPTLCLRKPQSKYPNC
ncbi:hypothetical protein [Pedobacter chitinilyticus]|uniref:Uncharacterized protein n=1 Tax=Pedobacter chitinilyticus TaxID=2233776 RepID=A0A443Z2A3_9SPHI|nr:hypothetical protein [Pedobacter chitinilyticus]RWU10668.1 hypothetical protein DPV69_04845 [Pedobacter chitinilyticus]